jgi:hypothetical protein
MQGLKDMYEWVRLMTGQTLTKAEIEALVLRQAAHAQHNNSYPLSRRKLVYDFVIAIRAHFSMVHKVHDVVLQTGQYRYTHR